MEPRGCNRWQSVANRIGAEAARTNQKILLIGFTLPLFRALWDLSGALARDPRVEGEGRTY